jgi:hypothetical protein
MNAKPKEIRIIVCRPFWSADSRRGDADGTRTRQKNQKIVEGRWVRGLSRRIAHETAVRTRRVRNDSQLRINMATSGSPPSISFLRCAAVISCCPCAKSWDWAIVPRPVARLHRQRLPWLVILPIHRTREAWLGAASCRAFWSGSRIRAQATWPGSRHIRRPHCPL